MKRMYYIGYMLCLLLAGCVVGEKADGLLEQRLSDRTLLVYMGGDNDLADETDEKLSALTEAWDRFPGHLLIYQDKKGADSTRLLEVCLDEQGEKVTKILAKYKQENSAGASVFARVVNEAMARYPSVDPGLIVFSQQYGRRQSFGYHQCDSDVRPGNVESSTSGGRESCGALGMDRS